MCKPGAKKEMNPHIPTVNPSNLAVSSLPRQTLILCSKITSRKKEETECTVQE